MEKYSGHQHIGYSTFLKMEEDPATGTMIALRSRNGETRYGHLANVHSPEACAGRGCAIHKHPSGHPLADAPMFWREFYGMVFRTCSHGEYHQDADAAAYKTSIGESFLNAHQCDGCCKTGSSS